MKKKDRFGEIDNALKELQKSISRLEGVDATDLSRKVDLFREELYAGISRWAAWSWPATVTVRFLTIT
jgi:hypothetical protein